MKKIVLPQQSLCLPLQRVRRSWRLKQKKCQGSLAWVFARIARMTEKWCAWQSYSSNPPSYWMQNCKSRVAWWHHDAPFSTCPIPVASSWSNSSLCRCIWRGVSITVAWGWVVGELAECQDGVKFSFLNLKMTSCGSSHKVIYKIQQSWLCRTSKDCFDSVILQSNCPLKQISLAKHGPFKDRREKKTPFYVLPGPGVQN